MKLSIDITAPNTHQNKPQNGCKLMFEVKVV